MPEHCIPIIWRDLRPFWYEYSGEEMVTDPTLLKVKNFIQGDTIDSTLIISTISFNAKNIVIIALIFKLII